MRVVLTFEEFSVELDRAGSAECLFARLKVAGWALQATRTEYNGKDSRTGFIFYFKRASAQPEVKPTGGKRT